MIVDNNAEILTKFTNFLKARFFNINCLSPTSEQASEEVANLTERKNLHTHVYGVKESVSL